MSKSRALHNREERKKNSSEGKVYSYGRGARKTTDYGEYALATGQVTRLPKGQSGSLKVQSMQKKKQEQTKNAAATGATKSAYEKAFGRKKR